MKLTKKAIEKLVLPPKDKPYSKIFHDDSQRGLALRVTSNGVKTFIINRKINGKVFRMRIGRFGDDYTLDQARKRAATLLGQLASGVNPVKQEKERSIQKLALRTAYDSYLKTRKTLKPKTKQDYDSIMKNIFSDWQEKSLREITRQMVSIRHAEIGKKHEARANNAFKLLSAVFNVAIYQHVDSESNVLTDNPVQVLTQTRAWFKPKRRTRKIDHQQLPAWFKSVYGLKQQSFNCVERSVNII